MSRSGAGPWALAAASVALLGCYHPEGHVTGTYASNDAPGEPMAIGEAERQPCTLAAGALQLAIPVPPGYALATSPEACMLVDEGSDSPVFVSFSSIPGDSERRDDALLAVEPDGVKQWALSTNLLGELAVPEGEGQARLLGAPRPYFVLRASPPGLDVPRDALLMTTTTEGEHLVVLGIAPPDDLTMRETLLALVAAVEIEGGDGIPGDAR